MTKTAAKESLRREWEARFRTPTNDAEEVRTVHDRYNMQYCNIAILPIAILGVLKELTVQYRALQRTIDLCISLRLNFRSIPLYRLSYVIRRSRTINNYKIEDMVGCCRVLRHIAVRCSAA